MERITCRLLPYALADGPHNMAADEVLLYSAQCGQLSLRFYGWTEPTVSLGYFQASAEREKDPRLKVLPFVRRPTGGATLVHHHELTYALALPPGLYRKVDEPWLTRMHRIIASALARLGIPCRLSAKQDQQQTNSPLCFQQFTPGDVLVEGSKIAGSAQRRQRGCLLQHGAILLRASPHALSLPGIQELAGRDLTSEACQTAIVEEFQQDTGWDLKEIPWQAAEQEMLALLLSEKYSSAKWNNKR